MLLNQLFLFPCKKSLAVFVYIHGQSKESMTSKILNKIYFWMELLLLQWQQKKNQYLPLYGKKSIDSST